MKIFIVCSNEGDALDVVKAKTFKEAYSKTVMKNNGDFIVEINKEVFEKMKKVFTE